MHFFLRYFASFRKLEKKFDLYYYDGLARQDEEIRLTVGKKFQHYLEINTRGDSDFVSRPLVKGNGDSGLQVVLFKQKTFSVGFRNSDQ